MTKDAFGHPIEFGTVIRVGKIRKDGKYPVAFIFKSTGRRINSILTKEKLDAEVSKPNVEVHGYARPKKTPEQLDAEIAEALRR